MLNFLRSDNVGKRDFPSSNFLLHVRELLKHTPDLAKLEEKKSHMVFVCDDLKKGHRRHSLLQDSEYLGQGFTRTAFCMWKQNLGQFTFPIPFPERDNLVPFSRVKGEVWSVPTAVLKELDKYKENTVQFQRMRVRLEVGFKNMYFRGRDAKLIYTSRSRMQHMRPWMYVGVSDYWNQLINGLEFGMVSQVEFGEHFYLKHSLREGAKYYEFRYKDYFEEKPIIVKRELKPLHYDKLGNQYTESEWKVRQQEQINNAKQTGKK